MISIRRRPLLCGCVLLGLASPSFAEPAPAPKPEPRETVFDAPTRVRLIAGPWTRLTLFGGSDLALLAGGGGGFLFYDRLVAMGYACSRGDRTAPSDNMREFSVSGFGGQIAWVLAPHERVHANIAALVGQLSATVVAKTDANDTATLDFFSVEPYAEVEVSLYAGLKVFAGGGYRILVGGASQAGIDRGYLRGPVLEVGFRMGS